MYYLKVSITRHIRHMRFGLIAKKKKRNRQHQHGKLTSSNSFLHSSQMHKYDCECQFDVQ